MQERVRISSTSIGISPASLSSASDSSGSSRNRSGYVAPAERQAVIRATERMRQKIVYQENRIREIRETFEPV
jgi:hypothetical protein